MDDGEQNGGEVMSESWQQYVTIILTWQYEPPCHFVTCRIHSANLQ